MSTTTTHQVDIAALHGALDTVRRFRGISWRQIANETGMSPSTLTRLGKGESIDADGFVTLLAWLGHGAALRPYITKATR